MRSPRRAAHTERVERRVGRRSLDRDHTAKLRAGERGSGRALELVGPTRSDLYELEGSSNPVTLLVVLLCTTLAQGFTNNALSPPIVIFFLGAAAGCRAALSGEHTLCTWAVSVSSVRSDE